MNTLDTISLEKITFMSFRIFFGHFSALDCENFNLSQKLIEFFLNTLFRKFRQTLINFSDFLQKQIVLVLFDKKN